MEKELNRVTQEQAISLKKLGFDFKCELGYPEKKGNTVKYLPKPTVNLALKWLRDKKGMHVSAHPTYNSEGILYMCTVFYVKDKYINNKLLQEEPLTIDYTPPKIFKDFEEAQSAGLDEVISILNN